MNNWREALPGFWLPNSWAHDESRWPDYTDDGYIRAIEDTPDISDVIRLRGLGQPTSQQWGAWLGAFNADRAIKQQTEFLAIIADRKYESARYVYLVPAWRRKMVEIATEIDDIEDQVSTILWVAETVARKWIPIPPKLLNAGAKLSKSLDCGGKLLTQVTPLRGGKSEYAECLNELVRSKKRSKEQKAGLLAWFQDNWGRLLEAAQATGTWFDIGIVLGPIMAYIDEGMWGAIKAEQEHTWMRIDAVIPGFKQTVDTGLELLNNEIEKAWDSTWGKVQSDGNTWQNVDWDQWEQ